MIVLIPGCETHLLSGHRLLASLGQLGNGPRFLPQVDLATNEDDRESGTKVKDFRDPLREGGTVVQVEQMVSSRFLARSSVKDGQRTFS